MDGPFIDTASNLFQLKVLEVKGNVTVYKGLFLELPSGPVIVITVYTFLSLY